MVERITLSLSLSLSLSLTHTHMTVHTPKPHLLPTSCITTGSKPQKLKRVGTLHRGEKNTRQKKRERKGDTQEVREWERVSERGDRRDTQGEKEGDDGCRRKVMARLERATHTHAHSHTQLKNSNDTLVWHMTQCAFKTSLKLSCLDFFLNSQLF